MTDFERTENYIRLKAVHPLAACVLIELTQEADALRARVGDATYAGMLAEARRIRKLRERRNARLS